MHGHDVAYAQHLLLNNKYHLDLHVGEEGRYDRKTAAATKRAKYLLGYYEPTEVFGTKLEKFLRPVDPHMELPLAYRIRRKRRLAKEQKNLGEKALDEAIRWIGTKETPPYSNNAVPFGPWYNHYVGPWCAVFVSYCLHVAGAKHVIPGYRWAYVPYVVDDARAQRYGLRPIGHAEVRPGDLACYDFPGESAGVADHIGFFEHWNGDSNYSFTAVEGNTGIGNNSNGGQVMRRTDRYLSEVQQFARVIE